MDTLQAIGMAAPMCLSRVILREIISDNTKYARLISFLGIGTLISPVIAPIIGSFLSYFPLESWFSFHFIGKYYIKELCMDFSKK